MPMDTRRLDAEAQKMGYEDYAHWKLWEARRQAPPIQHLQGQSTQPIENWFHMLFNDPAQAFARLMPQTSGIMKASDALGEANARNAKR